jgi:hypothetical protein
VECPGSADGALLEALAKGECRQRDRGCLGSGTGVAEVGGIGMGEEGAAETNFEFQLFE